MMEMEQVLQAYQMLTASMTVEVGMKRAGNGCLEGLVEEVEVVVMVVVVVVVDGRR
jgi:hypothetical protein